MKKKVFGAKNKIAKIARQFVREQIGIEVKRSPIPDDRSLYKQLYPEESLANRRFYSVSAGGHRGFGLDLDHPYWTNLDLLRPIAPECRQFNPERDVPYDMLDAEPLPIVDDSAEIVLSQYSIEHIPDDAAAFFFKESYRALKSNGILKIVTPNTALDVMAYHSGDIGFYDWVDFVSEEADIRRVGYSMPLNQASLEQVFLTHIAAAASCIHVCDSPNKLSDDDVRRIMKTSNTEDALNKFTGRCSVAVQKQYRENHMNWWTPQKIVRELEKVGFRHVTTLAPWQSYTPVLRNRAHFDKMANKVATFVEAVK